MLIDSHCHLDFEVFNRNHGIAGLIQRAQIAGVGLIQTICTRLSDFPNILSIAELYSMVYCSVGVHPLYIKEIPSAESLLEKCHHPKVIGIGETGLDYYRDGFDKKSQISSFIEHIITAQKSGLPIIIHVRSADEDLVSILKEMMSESYFTGVIHCFTASSWLAEECIKLGFYISASGIITFKNSLAIQNVFKSLPEDKILIETDAPFLSPVPHRGKDNEPSYIKETAIFLASIRSVSYEEIQKTTTDNFFRLFKKAASHFKNDHLISI